ncbi:MAG: hypothetical protein WC365_08980 [Candidatus Babeliales bacterium]
MTVIEITQIETETVIEASDIQKLIDAAVEHNIAYLLQQHSNPTKLMNTLRNTAIDNAFQEVTQRLDDLETTLTQLENGCDSGFLETAIWYCDLAKRLTKLESEQP